MINFDDFVKHNYSNTWIKQPGISLYVRKSHRGADYEIGNMNAVIPGRKSLTAFLNLYEPQYRFYIEQIFNERLIPYFEKRGYTIIGTYDTPHMIGPAK